MSHLSVINAADVHDVQLETSSAETIKNTLSEIGVQFEQWSCEQAVAAGADQETVLAAYASDVDRIMKSGGFKTADVISLKSDHPDKAVLRKKFLSEHTHSEDEVRFFVAGGGLFSLHIDECIYEVECSQGDLISVPAGIPHWFDMGAEPSFACIRIFTDESGWVANYTGSDIADRFNRYEPA